jgi:hypothetical protein
VAAVTGQGGWAGFVGAVVGGAVGSAAGQEVAIGLDMQQHFSWKQVGMSAIEAGVTAGIGSYAGQAGLAGKLGLANYLGQDLSLAFNAMASNLAVQSIGRATGWQTTGFSWRNAAAAALAAPVASEVNDFITQGPGVFDDYTGKWVSTKSDYSRWVGDFGTRLTTAFVSGVAAQAIKRRVTGSGDLNYANIGAQAFGTTLGNTIVQEAVKAAHMPGVLGSGLTATPGQVAAWGPQFGSYGNGTFDYGDSFDSNTGGKVYVSRDGVLSLSTEPETSAQFDPNDLGYVSRQGRAAMNLNTYSDVIRDPNDHVPGQVTNLYQPGVGYFASSLRSAAAGIVDPNSTWMDIGANALGTAGLLGLGALDMVGEAAYNAPNNLWRGVQGFANAFAAPDTESWVKSILGGLIDTTNGINGLLGPLTLGSAGAAPLTAEQRAVQGFPGIAATRAAEETYLGAEGPIPVRIEGTRVSSATPDSLFIGFKENDFIYAEAALKEGELKIALRTYQDQGLNRIRVEGFTGEQAYNEIFNYFGDRVTSVSDNYISDNARAFNTNVAAGQTFEEAAMNTWSGRQMQARGFVLDGKVDAVLGSDGLYEDIRALWRRAP